MFWRRKSYSRFDVLEMAALLREIEEDAEQNAPPIVEGMLEWAKKDPSNKRKVNRAFGIMSGIVTGKYAGSPCDFGRFFKEVIKRTYNYGFGANFGKMMFRDHTRLQKQKDEDYVAGRKDGLIQAVTGEDLYLRHRKTW
jgi:hypothetical protein